MTIMKTIVAGAILAAVLPGAGHAQSLAQRIGSAPDGEVVFSFAARPGVCGNGAGMIGDHGHRMWISRHNFSMSDDGDDRHCPCGPGPVRVALRLKNHRILGLETVVGGTAQGGGGTDLGSVSVVGATDFLLSLAAGQDPEVGKEAILPATLADTVRVWPRLLALARDRVVDHEVRQSAVFWVSQAAEEAATRGLDSLVSDAKGDREIREQAVFALSQRPREEGVPILIRIAKSNRDPEIRRKALFWLGQSGDSRALALFEEILTKK